MIITMPYKAVYGLSHAVELTFATLYEDCLCFAEVISGGYSIWDDYRNYTVPELYEAGYTHKEIEEMVLNGRPPNHDRMLDNVDGLYSLEERLEDIIADYRKDNPEEPYRKYIELEVSRLEREVIFALMNYYTKEKLQIIKDITNFATVWCGEGLEWIRRKRLKELKKAPFYTLQLIEDRDNYDSI